jgi:preprotein translocase SecE subunit
MRYCPAQEVKQILNYIIMNRLINYIKDTQAEMAHVSWPTRKQAVIYTILVVSISGLVALYTSGFDYLFSKMLNLFISNY